MANRRVLPPVSGNLTVRLSSGRSYTGVVGTPQDVADFDANVLVASGWTDLGEVGATGARPSKPQRGQMFLDTTVGKAIFYDGATWRDLAGSAV